MLGIYSAMTRKTIDGISIAQEQCVGLLDAIRMYTYNAAYAGFDEKNTGSIEVGKLADLTVWSGRLLSMRTEEIKASSCLMTMIGGEILYKEGE